MALQNTLIRVLSGSVLVSSSKRLVLNEDTCLLARGLIQLRAVAPDSSNAGGSAICSAVTHGDEEDGRSDRYCDPAAGEGMQAPAALWAIRNVDKNVIVEPLQTKYNQYSKKIVIKKIFNCTDLYYESFLLNKTKS